MAWETKDWVAAYAAVVSTVVFLWTVGREIYDRRRTKQERSRLHVHMSVVRVKNRPDGKIFHILPLHVSNLGREPVIVTGVVARGPGNEIHPGVFAEPGAAYGGQERVLPKKLEAGETIELPLFTAAIFRNEILAIVVLDADNREYKVSTENLQRLREQCVPLLSEG